MLKVHKINPFFWNKNKISFLDSRFKKILFRMRARNFFDTLCLKDKKKWMKYCLCIFNDKDIFLYKNEISNLYNKNFLIKKNKYYLIESLNYINKIVHFVFLTSISLDLI